MDRPEQRGAQNLSTSGYSPLISEQIRPALGIKSGTSSTQRASLKQVFFLHKHRYAHMNMLVGADGDFCALIFSP